MTAVSVVQRVLLGIRSIFMPAYPATSRGIVEVIGCSRGIEQIQLRSLSHDLLGLDRSLIEDLRSLGHRHCGSEIYGG